MGVPTRYKPGRRGAVDSEDETAAGSSRASSSSRRVVPGSDALETDAFAAERRRAAVSAATEMPMAVVDMTELREGIKMATARGKK